MKVKVVKPGTILWDSEQGVVVKDTPITVRATGIIRDALNSKVIVEVSDDEIMPNNLETGSSSDEDQDSIIIDGDEDQDPIIDEKVTAEDANLPVEEQVEVPAGEAAKQAKKLSIKGN